MSPWRWQWDYCSRWRNAGVWDCGCHSARTGSKRRHEASVNNSDDWLSKASRHRGLTGRPLNHSDVTAFVWNDPKGSSTSSHRNFMQWKQPFIRSLFLVNGPSPDCLSFICWSVIIPLVSWKSPRAELRSKEEHHAASCLFISYCILLSHMYFLFSYFYWYETVFAVLLLLTVSFYVLNNKKATFSCTISSPPWPNWDTYVMSSNEFLLTIVSPLFQNCSDESVASWLVIWELTHTIASKTDTNGLIRENIRSHYSTVCDVTCCKRKWNPVCYRL